MVINDLHLPFEDKKAVSLVLDILDDLKLDRLVINGDLLDFYNVNMHGPKHPDVITTLEDELYAGREFIKELRDRFPKLHIVYNAGNHETRVNRFILKNSKAFWNVLTVEKYLRLEENEIEWYPYNNKYQLEETSLFIQHSPSSYSSPMANLKKKLDQSFIFGCTHRAGAQFLTGGSGEIYGVYFNGNLASVNETSQHKEVFSYAKGHTNWQQSFCIITVENEIDFHVIQYLIKDHKVVVDGSLYSI